MERTWLGLGLGLANPNPNPSPNPNPNHVVYLRDDARQVLVHRAEAADREAREQVAALRQVHEKPVVVVKRVVVVRLLALFGSLPSLLSGFFLLLQHERHLAQHVDRATRLELERMLSGQG